jgi:hypothetical protein
MAEDFGKELFYMIMHHFCDEFFHLDAQSNVQSTLKNTLQAGCHSGDV